jgi:Ras-related protein Rab-11A
MILGDKGVGKSSLLKRLGKRLKTENGFIVYKLAQYDGTSIDHSYFSMERGDRLYKISFWDPKIDDLEMIHSAFYAGTFGALVCFDPSKPETFDNLDKWINELIRHTHTEGTPLVLVATKMDLYNRSNAGHMDLGIMESYRNQIINKLGGRFEVHYWETSSLTGLNILTAFDTLVNSVDKWNKSRGYLEF